MAFNYSPKIVTDGLVLYLDAANPKSYTSGSTTWRDLTRNGNNGTLTNGPIFSSANNGSIVFDGTNDYVDLGSLSILNITGQLTINSWVRINAFPSSIGTIYEKGFNGSAEQTFFRFRNNNGIQVVDVGTYRSSGNINFSTIYIVGSTITVSSWNNIVGQYDGANWNIFLNGNLVSQTLQNQGPIASTSPASIGAAYISNGFSRFLNGNISNVQLYNRALSSTEIQQNFNATRGRFGI